MRKAAPLIFLSMLWAVASLISAADFKACSRSRPFSFEELFGGAQIIVRATAVRYETSPGDSNITTTGAPGSTVEFKIEEKLRGAADLSDSIALNGYLTDKDDYNELPVPYHFVRPNGRRGSCFANAYKKGAQFLLFLKKTDGDGYTPNFSALGPVNEQLRSDDDAWLVWVRNRLSAEMNSSAQKTDGAPPEIYIPADKRHRGLSRFDLIPFTDRRKGDPDRYRAVNPNFVKKDNGNYYFLLNAKTGAHFYDENLNDKGILPNAKVEIDLTNIKTAEITGGKTRKYFYIKDTGYLAAESLTQTPADIRAGRWFYFPLKSGEHRLYDGTGSARGRIAAESVKLNYGQTKEMTGERYYYAFSTKIFLGESESIGASGWIKASALETGNDPQYAREFVEKMQIPTEPDDVFNDYEITGGNPQETIGAGADGKPKYKFGYAGAGGEFVAYKVLPGVPLDGKQSIAVTDYLKRADDVINLGFNVAGVSSDTFRIGGANRLLIFHRSSDRDTTAAIDLFYPKSSTHDGEKPVAKMIFVYGYVAAPNGKRWGWLPLDALKPKP